MRTTKVYSITMPPDLARKAERLAKKESRTMSELMREALRRYDQPQAAMADALAVLRADAHAKGLGRTSKREINEIINGVRSETRIESKSSKRSRP